MKGTLKKEKESKKRNGEESNDEERLRHFGNKIMSPTESSGARYAVQYL